MPFIYIWLFYWFGNLSTSILVAASCDLNQFACKNGGECVSANQRCDHVTDCGDGSDEVDCSYLCRSPHMKPCRDGHCIAMYFFCDRENDCGDWSDELNCTGTTVPGSSLTCPTNTFHCDGQLCIPQDWLCDGMDDCSDARDEMHCNKECKSGFQCGKECILNQWVCDGVADCVDGSDEKECGPDAYMNHSCLPEHGWFSCISKGNQKCMPISRACDGYVDCDDRADEGGQCNSTTNCSNSTQCPNGCHKTPTGPVCSCPTGLQLSGKACVDIDECAITPPMCSQKCSNTIGGYDCSCVSGYTLNTRDKRTCVANGPELMLFITTDRDIRYISLPSKEYGLIQSGISQAHGVAGDFEDGFVYWNEKSKDGKAGIYKSMLDGSAYQYVVSVGVEMVEDLAIDWVGSHVYFADSGRKHIVVCDLHGKICTVVISGQLDKPRAVAVYPEEGLLFWSDWGSHPHIGSAGMDGSTRTNIITSDIIWPNGLVVDETIQRIFWGDAKLNRIESSRIDGTDRKILPVAVTHPYALDVFENMIYWCDPIEHEVLSVDKLSGKNRKVLIKEASLTPTGIHVHHPSKQSHIPNPCRNVICSHLCLLASTKEGFRCACPVGMTLNKDNRTCDTSATQPSSIVIATFTDIYRLTHHQIGKDSIIRLPTRNVENIGALAFNPMGHSIVYSDLTQKAIYSMHLETYRQTVLFENADMVEGLDVDPYTEKIYWTEVSQGAVVIGHKNHDGAYERLVLARELHSPKGISLAPEFGLMFIVEGRISHVISVWHMDGGWRQELVQVYGTVSAMAFDGKHLYFSDSLRGTIERIEVDGQNRTILRTHLGTPVGMDVSTDSVFWLTQFSTRISWLNKQEPKTMRGFVIDAADANSVQYRLMSVVDQFDFSHEHVCLALSGSCNGICVPTPTEAKCLCPIGKVLSQDKHICTTTNCIGEQWFKCQSGCIPSKNRCDGVNDCALGEDEKNCRNVTTEVGCSSNQFQCKNGGCISSHFYCDGDKDCQDASDEPNTCPPHTCTSDADYACPNQHVCIPRSAVCDGNADCDDKSDEGNCTTMYLDSTQSITSTVNDLDISPCKHEEFVCANGQCISMDSVCDGVHQCSDGTDEGPRCKTSCENNGNCSQICIPGPKKPTCACMPCYELQKSSSQCVHVDNCTTTNHCELLRSIHPSSIVIATFTDIYHLICHSIGENSITRLPTRNVKNIGALAFNPSSHSIIYSDKSRKTIYSMHLKTNHQIVLFENVNKVEGLAVDSSTENIYWTQASDGTVMIGHKNRYGVYERLLLTRGLNNPKSITLATKLGLMFIVEGRTSNIVRVCHMDGNGRKKLLQVHGFVSGMAFDGKYLYFSDSLLGSIERIQVDGKHRTVIRSDLGAPIALDAISNSVFWLTQNSTRLSWINSQAPNQMRGFIFEIANVSVQYRLIAILDQADSRHNHNHLCTEPSALNCSDICVPTPNKAKCLCPLGKSLSEDLVICRNDTVKMSQKPPKSQQLPIQTSNKTGCNVGYSERLEFKSTLEAILDGPVHVQSRLFTKKGHSVDHGTMFNRENAPVPINPVWDTANQTARTRFVEDFPVPDGNRLVLWKIFHPKAYNDVGNLRTVHLMELRTLRKMGFNVVDINLAKWSEFAEPDKVTFLIEKVDTMLSNTTRIQ